MLRLASEIQELIEVEAQDALASGWAELTLTDGDLGPSLRLEPVKMTCAPLEIYFDSEQLVICSPGRKGMSCEFFSEDRDEVKSRTLALAAAVVAGSYAERMRQGSSELEAEWPGPDGREKAVREPLIASGLGGGEWVGISYEQY